MILAAWYAACFVAHAQVDSPFDSEEHWLVATTVQELEALSAFAKARRKITQVLTVSPVGDDGRYQVRSPQGEGVNLQSHPHVWTPAVYRALADKLLQNLDDQPDTTLANEVMEELLHPTVSTLMKANRQVRAALRTSPRTAAHYEAAALLVGTQALRDCATRFEDTRQNLCRMTAFLATASALSNGKPGDCGKLAVLIIECLAGRTAHTVELLNKTKLAHPKGDVWKRVIRMRATRDWRLLDTPREATHLEQLTYFRAVSEVNSPGFALRFLTQNARRLTDCADWMMMTTLPGMTVHQGNLLVDRGAQALVSEVNQVFGIDGLREPGAIERNLKEALAIQPEGVAIKPGRQRLECQPLDNAAWSSFYQRAFLRLAQQNHMICHKMQGLPEAWTRWSKSHESLFESMALFPLLHYLFAEDQDDFAERIAQGIAFAKSRPGWCPIGSWSAFEKPHTPFEAAGKLGPIQPWFQPLALRRTAHMALLRTSARLGGEDPANLETWLTLDPWEMNLATDVAIRRNKLPQTIAEARQLLGDLIDYSAFSMDWAATQLHKGGHYDAWLTLSTKACEINPDDYTSLAYRLVDMGREAEAPPLFAKAFDLAMDRVALANSISWYVYWLLGDQQFDEAKRVAQLCEEVHSARGLETAFTHAVLTKDPTTALRTAKALHRRYEIEDPLAVVGHAFPEVEDVEARRAQRRIFPEGLKPFEAKGAPAAGVRFDGDSPYLQKAGVRPGEIVVALDGLTVETPEQYFAIRGLHLQPQLDLVLWDGQGYRERRVKTTPNGRRLQCDVKPWTSK